MSFLKMAIILITINSYINTVIILLSRKKIKISLFFHRHGDHSVTVVFSYHASSILLFSNVLIIIAVITLQATRDPQGVHYAEPRHSCTSYAAEEKSQS